MPALLRYSADRRTLALVALGYAFTFGGYYMFWSMPTWLVVPWVMGACWMAFVTAVSTHNCVHVPMFHSRSMNRAWQFVLTLGYGHPVSAYVPGHNLSHHVHTQTRKDVMRTSKMRFRWNFLNQTMGAVVMGKDIFAADLAYASAMRTERPRWFRQWVAEWVVFLLVQVTLLVLDPIAFFVMMFIPHNFAASGIIGINFLQHDGCDQDSQYNHSRNLVGPILNWWCFNNGFHTIHHLHPGLHWSEAREAHNAEIAPHIHPNLDVENSAIYFFKAYIFPAHRLDYLGKPVVLGPEGPDESWIPGRHDTPANVSLGAEA